MARRPDDALGRHQAAQGAHRLGAVRRRAAARLRPAVHQGARPLARRAPSPTPCKVAAKAAQADLADEIEAALRDVRRRAARPQRAMAKTAPKDERRRRSRRAARRCWRRAAAAAAARTSIAGISTRPTSRPSSTPCASWCARRSRAPRRSRRCPGAAALLRELRAGGGARICFISGSPRQMRRVLTKKLRLDGVEFDEFILKPNLRNMLTRPLPRAARAGRLQAAGAARRPRRPAAARRARPASATTPRPTRFVYSLYADVRRRPRRPRAARGDPRRAPASTTTTRARTLTLADALPPRRRGATASSSTSIAARRPRASIATARAWCPIYNYFQAALVLFEDGLLDADAVVRVALEMVDQFGYSLDALRNSLQDLLRRGRLRRATARALGRASSTDEGDPAARRAARRRASCCSPSPPACASSARCRR